MEDSLDNSAAGIITISPWWFTTYNPKAWFITSTPRWHIQSASWACGMVWTTPIVIAIAIITDTHVVTTLKFNVIICLWVRTGSEIVFRLWYGKIETVSKVWLSLTHKLCIETYYWKNIYAKQRKWYCNNPPVLRYTLKNRTNIQVYYLDTCPS